MRRCLLALLCLLVLVPAQTAFAEDPFDATEEYFPSGDGTSLHADILRPKGLPVSAKTPVLLTVSPYLNHAAQTGLDYDPDASGPSRRFIDDFLIPGKFFERGYTYVMVNLRGSGGSGGCLDWGGLGERMDVKASVEWAATQPWSTGKVGHFGKSYDGWTGLMALAERPKGLAAVLSMEPVYSGYRYFWTNGIRIGNTFGTPAAFQVIDFAPGSPTNDDPQYILNSPPTGCQAATVPQMSGLDDESAQFWVDRNLLPPTKGATVPLFLTQGLLETNTKPDGAFDVYRDHAGYKRAWFGQFDHVRGWEKAGEDYLTGRTGFLEESIQFFDHFVRGDGPAPPGPGVAAQDSRGRYRGEDAWPPSDVKVFRSKLNDGSYTDDGENNGSGGGSGVGIWSVSQPLATAAHLAGEPVVRGTAVSTAPRANLVANVYDVDPDGKGVLVSRGATLLRTSEVNLTLYGQDWVFDPGHRIGVLISSANAEWWRHVPNNAPVDVASAAIELPFKTYDTGPLLDGRMTTRLEAHLSSAVITAPTGGEVAFELPPALLPKPVATVTPTPPVKPAAKLTVKVKRTKKGLVVTGSVPKGAFLSVTALRGKKIVGAGTGREKRGRYTVKLFKRKAQSATKIVVRAAGQRVTRKVPRVKRRR